MPAARMSSTRNAFFMVLAFASIGGPGLPSASNDRNTGTVDGRLLHTLELDDGLLVVENGAKLGVLCRGQIALGLHNEEVRRHPDLELAFLGVQLFFGQLAGRPRGVDPLLNALDL